MREVERLHAAQMAEHWEVLRIYEKHCETVGLGTVTVEEAAVRESSLGWALWRRSQRWAPRASYQ